jgi:hypothetical protein
MAKTTAAQRWKRYRELQRERHAADSSVSLAANEFRARGMTDGQIAAALQTVRRLTPAASPVCDETPGFHMDSGPYDPRGPHPGYRRVEANSPRNVTKNNA